MTHRGKLRSAGGEPTRKKTALPRLSRRKLEAMLEEALVDCYGEGEEASALFTMIEDRLAIPFETMVLGVPVTVTGVDLLASGEIVAICARGRDRQSIRILDLSLPSPPPAGVEWLAVYRYWRRQA